MFSQAMLHSLSLWIFLLSMRLLILTCREHHVNTIIYSNYNSTYNKSKENQYIECLDSSPCHIFLAPFKKYDFRKPSRFCASFICNFSFHRWNKHCLQSVRNGSIIFFVLMKGALLVILFTPSINLAVQQKIFSVPINELFRSLLCIFFAFAQWIAFSHQFSLCQELFLIISNTLVI